MAETSGAPPLPARTLAYCAWHQGYSETCRLVQAADIGSGPQMPGLFACADCRNIHQLLPVADPTR